MTGERPSMILEWCIFRNRRRPLCRPSPASSLLAVIMLVIAFSAPMIAGIDVDARDEEGFLRGTGGLIGTGTEGVVEEIEEERRRLANVMMTPRINRSVDGEGGTLKNGRGRCFVDEDGYHRCYPTVFFLGTSKCATTSLARWLDAHPATHWVANPRRPHQIEQTGVKEAHVFDDPPKGNRLEDQVLLHEKLFITSPKVHADSVVIDYTPHYLAVAETPHRISDMYGKNSGLKFIVTLREPAGRAISSWEFKNEFNPKKGRQEEKRSLLKTVGDGIKRGSKLLACVDLAKNKRITNRERDLQQCNPRRFLEMPLFVSHVGKSMYPVQLERWFNLFGRENFKVVFTDDMAVDPVGVLEDVLEFLELDLTDEDESKGLPTREHWKKITGMAYNKTKSKKKDELAEQVTDELKQDLRNFFEPQNRELEKLLGYPVPAAWNY
ncbi:unnamed protein product [Ascophyllum nodosum]